MSNLLPSPAQAARPELAARPSLRQLWWDSLYLGAIGFGGGLSVLAVLERLAVQRRRWVSEQEFDSAASVSQMLPGGAAANALALIGLRLHGLVGALLGYVGFVAPGAVAIIALAWVYVRFGEVPHAESFLNGLNAAVVGVIVAITLKMSKTSVTRLWQMALAAAALLLSAVGGSSSGELALMGIAVGLLVKLSKDRGWAFGRAGGPVADPPPVPPPPEDAPPRDVTLRSLLAPSLAVLVPAAIGHLLVMGTVLFRTGLGAYGGGFAVIPSLHTDVRAHGWISEQQFADAVAVGKLTPGPVLLMATFIGYLTQGVAGAIVATAAIMSGPFLLVIVFGTTLERLRGNAWVQAGLAGLSATVVGLMAAAALTLGTGFHTVASAAIATAVALTLVRFEVNPVAMLAVGGLLRLGLSFAGV